MYIDIETYVLDQEADTYSILCINHSLLNINDIQLMIRGAHTWLHNYTKKSNMEPNKNV